MEIQLKEPGELTDDEIEDLNESMKLIRKMMIKSVMSQMGWWERLKFRLFLVWLRIRRLWA